MSFFKKRNKVRVLVNVESIVLAGSGVEDKEMYYVHWTLKGLHGKENSGDTANVRSGVSEERGAVVARFADVCSGEVSAKVRKDRAGYEEVPLDLKVVVPALHKKEDQTVGKATVNLFEGVEELAAGAPQRTEQTVALGKDGAVTATLAVTLELKSGDAAAGDDDTSVGEASVGEPETETAGLLSGLAGTSSGVMMKKSSVLVVTPPASPQKEASASTSSVGSDSESAGASQSAASEDREGTASRRSHRHKHHSSTSATVGGNSAAAFALLKQKEDGLKQKEQELTAQKKELEDQLAAKAKEAAEAQARAAELEEENKKLAAAVSKAEEEAAAAKKEAQEAQEAQSQDLGDKGQELDLLKSQLEALREECNKLRGAPKADAAKAVAKPGMNQMVVLAIVGAIGAILGAIIARLI